MSYQWKGAVDMKKIIVLMCSIFLVVTLAACGDIDEKNTRAVQGKEEVVADQETSEGEDVEEAAEEPEEKPVGTRSNPLPFGDTITVKENIYDDSFNGYAALVEVTLLEAIRGEAAWEMVKAENQFNEPAEEGYEYVLISVKGFLKEAETEDDSLYFSDMKFKFVSEEGEVYDWASVVTPNELSKELYNGGTAEGNIINQVKIGEDFKVSYDSSEGSPVFFSVE